MPDAGSAQAVDGGSLWLSGPRRSSSPSATGWRCIASPRPAIRCTPRDCVSAAPWMAARCFGPRYFSQGYLFVLIELQWHTARWSPGVVRIVLNGGTPAAVPDGVIAQLKEREVRGLIELPRLPKFHPGDRVRVLHGPFAGHIGLYAGMRPRERIEVLLALLGGHQRVTLPKGDVGTV
jgi:hypothetical protein